jgi:hypothetical protein
MNDNTTLDAAIGAAQEQVYNNQERVVDPLDRTYARALIAKLLEGMEMAELSHWHAGFNAALTEIRRRAGIEGDK